MKKIIIALLLLSLCSSSLFAQGASIINGEWDRKNPGEIKLFKVNRGELNQIASTKVTEDKRFTFAFLPEKEGYYVIGLAASGPRNRYAFYFKPGDQLNVKMTADYSYELVGNTNTPENEEIARWQKFKFPIEEKSVYYLATKSRSTYVDFFPLFEEKLEALKEYPVAKTGNAVFNDSFEKYKKCDILFLAMNFIMTPRTAHPQGEDYPDYYRNINATDFSKDNFLMDYPEGINLLSNTYMASVRLNESLSNEDKTARMSDPAAFLFGGPDDNQILNPELKGELTLKYARANKSAVGFSDYKKKYEKYLVTESQKKRWNAFEASLNKNAVGTDAIDFKFPDINGKEIALSDFKGKVVYIDVWATWCGPCKKEFPHLKELEAGYHGNNDIVFMGVNIDISKDIQKWKNFLDKEQLPGIQIFAGDNANKELMSLYSIKSIPRFILVGKDGKLLFADAPRPSSAEIKKILDDAIKK